MSTSGHLVVKLLAAPTDGKRIITGWASTDDVDLVGDICEPAGCIAKTPLPLLFGHNHESIIGSVTSVVIEATRVRIEATIVEGTAKADEAWTLIRAGALTSFSVGFIGHKSTAISTGGRRWTSWTLTEVSAVAVPANPFAKITGSSNAKELASPHAATREILQQNLATARSLANKRAVKKGLSKVRESSVSWTFHQLNFVSAMKRIASLERRLADSPKYLGIFNRTAVYSRGDVVSHGGSAFYCVRDGVSSAPTHEGSDAVSADWQIFVRRGRDARGDSR
ncbi:HK97 family phage prohead protease [Panacagrimonas perspica]|uniref:HK97 family phage prohead protease n=1 Tax=Panacagrimonas perspica TaxID=381431 RepID=A0A4R7PB61_9GAMM|nr:HK97 family phage prohead protease [Panacagrimonas perspica]TDU31313.1 HK97 family phage prohead protease [Panacagrimonas perspica]THD02654.1 hypothetical protein B1810_14015 [Panacagrimonas perspica]